MEKILLNGEWLLKNPQTNTTYKATVPGDVHNDLLNSSVIPDPYYSDNANNCAWVAEQDWIYEKKFNITEEMLQDKIKLVFDGIDTFSEIYINDVKIADTNNMFLRYAFKINDYVSVGENTLTVKLLSIRKKASEFPKEGYFGCFDIQRIFIRKAQCHFSWDWAPNFPAMGIWQDVRLEILPGNEISHVIIRPELDGRAALIVHLGKDLNPWDVGGKFLRVKVWDCDTTIEKTVSVDGYKTICNIFIDDVKLWWPKFLGEPHLYNYEVTLIENEKETHTKCGRFGFRTVEHDQSPADTQKFYCKFKINGVEIFLKGANWVPLDIMTGCIPDDKYCKAIQMAHDANFNCLRVWGGGIYEKDIFFDLCDETGMLVWQDFQFACADIPDDYEGFNEQVIEEVEYQISRLQTHPSFFVATGGNEKTGTVGQLKSRGDHLVYYTLCGMCHHLDGTRPYMPSSPYSFGSVGNDLTSGDSHVNSYEPSIGHGRFTEFRDILAEREAPMASEIAVQGACRVESLKKYIPQESLWPVNEIYNLHFTRNPYDGYGGIPFVEKQIKAATEAFGEFDCLTGYVKHSMALHSEYVRADSEFHRSRKGDCGGAMFWMCSDIWPSGTWALLDYYMIPKASYYAAKRSYKPVTPIVTKHKDGTFAFVVNDTLSDINGTLNIRYTDVNGNIYSEKSATVNVAPNTSAKILYLDDIIESGTNRIVIAELITDTDTTKTFYFPDLWKDVAWCDPKLKVSIERKCDKCATVTITATAAYARMVNIIVPEFSGTYMSDNFFDMEKGETRVIEIKADQPFATEDIAVKTWLDEWDR